MRLRLSSVLERLRASLFLVPMVAVVGAIGLAFVALALDSRLDTNASELPLGIGSTVESARALLSTIAGATISFAGIAFSISLLVIQLASSQYSPRVVHTLFRDPFNRRVMAVVVGTFTYCLVVLRAVRSSLEDGGEPVVPNLAVALAVVLGIATVLAVIALIDHNAHAMDIPTILRKVTTESFDQRHAGPSDAAVVGTMTALHQLDATQVREVVRAETSGWVQQVDVEALRRCPPAGATIQLETYPGRFAIAGAPLARVWTTGSEGDIDPARLRGAVVIGDSRSMQQDPSYGLRQIADVALRALSPGVNDPTTAQEAIYHAGAVLSELLVRPEPPRVLERAHGGLLLLPEAPHAEELIGLAFDEVRRSAGSHPTVCVYLLDALGQLHEAVGPSSAEVDEALVAQAHLVVAQAEAAGLEQEGLETVRAAHRARFGPSGHRP
jgi:uncharacterized membrane protein